MRWRWTGEQTVWWLGASLAIGGVLALAILGWFGYQAVVGWRQTSADLAERRADEAADLLAMALTRDMRGVQTLVLTSPPWERAARDEASDLSNLAASVFARYPYPESLFVWQVRDADGPRFFNRAERPPTWQEAVDDTRRFPVRECRDPVIGRAIAARISQDADKGRRWSAFEIALKGQRYQVVAALSYPEPDNSQLIGAVGFTVNLDWVRSHYFDELSQQVSRIAGVDGLRHAVTDERGRAVVGSSLELNPENSKRRRFSLVFLDPLIVALDPPADLPQREWTIHVDANRDPALLAARKSSYQALAVSSVAACALAIGLATTARAAWAVSRLSNMRNELVSTVTHELKTPTAAIRLIGDTMAASRVANVERVPHYGGLLVKEATRLMRLIDNLLAYARITDVTEAYMFEPLDLPQCVTDALRAFTTHLAAGGFEVDVQVPSDLPRIRADRLAVSLLLDNLIDNAIRYSDHERWLQVRATAVDHGVLIEVSDRGRGIPIDQLELVTRRFVRGRGVKPGGTGLGLAIVRRITGDHGGAMVLRSTENAGTTVAITLPAYQS